MKKTLLLILIALLVILAIYIALKGFSIGGIEVLSYKEIDDRDEQLEETIKKASKLAEKDFKDALSEVEQNTKKLISVKREYEDMVSTSLDGTETQGQIQEYKIETLWVKLGTYATKEGAILQMDVTNSSVGGNGRYDLNFTVNGSYIGITDFVSDIENDSVLGFKIEGFTIKQSSSENDLVATFVCRNIAIQDVQATTNASNHSNLMGATEEEPSKGKE